MPSTTTTQDISVDVVPIDDIQIQVDAKLPADRDAVMKALIFYGAAAELGPSDHVPSYSPVDPDKTRKATFLLDLRDGEAFGGLLLVAGDIVWPAAFHRFKLTGGAVERRVFADQVCTLEVERAPHASAVLLRREMQQGPAGEPCYAYSVTGKGHALMNKTMLLHFVLSGSVDPATLKAYLWSGTNGWSEAPGFKLSDDESQLQVPIQVNHIYAISGQ
jgi:hypothetical protein